MITFQLLYLCDVLKLKCDHNIEWYVGFCWVFWFIFALLCGGRGGTGAGIVKKNNFSMPQCGAFLNSKDIKH